MATGITEFDLNSLICGRFTIGKDYIIVIADEKVYQFFGNGSLYPVNKLVHEEDRRDFEILLENSEYNVPIIVRIKRSDGIYRWCVAFTVNRNLMVNQETYTELEIRDILSINNRFSLVDQKLNKYRNFLNLINDRFFEYDFKTGIIKIYTYKDTRSEMLEMDTLDEFENRSLRLNFVEDTSIIPFKQLCQNIRNGLASFTVQFETSILRKGERKEVLNFRGQTIFRGNEITLVVGLITTVNKRLPEKDYYYSSVDSNLDCSTGLMNKKAITEFATNKVAALNLGNVKETLYFIILDIDNFKSVNDTYGHMFGDQVILKLANTLKNAIGNRGVAGRIGGDEFLILLENVNEIDELRNILKSVRKSMAFDFNDKISNYKFTCSIGISQYAKDALDYVTLFRIADKALYIAKNKGGDRYIIYDLEKHGVLEGIESKTILSKTALPMMKMIDKTNMVSDLVLMLYELKTEAIQYILDELVKRMNISGISVFIGEELNCAYSAGFYNKIISNAGYIKNENFLELFNEYGINTINNIERLALEYPLAYSLWKNSDICSSLQVLFKDKNNTKGIISFDITGNNRRKWSEVDISFLYFIAKTLGKVIMEAYK